MKWLVQLIANEDGVTGDDLDERYTSGTIVEDDRGRPDDLVTKANEEWGTEASVNEEYAVMAVSDDGRHVRVTEHGAVDV